jgi:hypothetical protein
MTDTYRNWRVYDDPGALHPDYVWHATSPNYAPDYDEDGFFADAGTYTYAATREELIAEIDAIIEDAAQ